MEERGLLHEICPDLVLYSLSHVLLLLLDLLSVLCEILFGLKPLSLLKESPLLIGPLLAQQLVEMPLIGLLRLLHHVPIMVHCLLRVGVLLGPELAQNLGLRGVSR